MTRAVQFLGRQRIQERGGALAGGRATIVQQIQSLGQRQPIAAADGGSQRRRDKRDYR